MSYDARKLISGQEVVHKVTLHLKACKYALYDLDHSGKDDGSCYGFSSTCSTGDSYDSEAIFQMSFCDSIMPSGSIYFSGLITKSIKLKGPTLDSGETMGRRGSLDFSIEDGRDNDVNIVPYTDRQTNNGTLAGKMIARHPYFSGIKVQHFYGLRDAGSLDEPEWVANTFFVDDATLSDGIWSFKCLDSLSFSDESKALMPSPSAGRLATAITGATTSFSVYDAPDYYYGEVLDQVYIQIDKEVFFVSINGAASFNIVTRAVESDEKDHSVGATVQLCFYAENIHAVELIQSAMVDYSSVPQSHIDDYSDLISETSHLIMSRVLIPKPEKTKTIIDLAIKIGGLKFFSNKETSKIVIKKDDETSIKPISFDESLNIIDGSVKIKTKESDQITHFLHAWAPKRITDTKIEDFQVQFMPVDLSLISNKKRGDLNIGKEVKNTLLSISTSDSLLGAAYSSRRLSKSARIPQTVEFKVTAASVGNTESGVVEAGTIGSFTSKESQNKDGSERSDLYEIVSINGTPDQNFTITAKLYQSTVIDSGDIDFSINESKENYDLSVDFAPIEAGVYVIYIAPSVVIGSTNTGNAALDTGTQAAGVSFIFIVRGAIYGMGGNGGGMGDGDLIVLGTGLEVHHGADGLAGGDAINCTVPCDFDFGEGLVHSGGGGGSGGPWFDTPDYGLIYTYGGGGGRGYAVSYGNIEPNSQYPEANGSIVAYGVANEAYREEQYDSKSCRGGDWGENGQSEFINNFNNSSTDKGVGGIAGAAIRTNGNLVNILAGNNKLNIKGLII